MVDTVLVMSGIGVPRYSARGLKQTLEPVEQAVQNARTINGVLHDLSDENFKKYKSVITGADQRSPALSGIFPGMIVEVDCAVELAYDANLSPSPYTRDMVPGSLREEEGFWFYRPRLTMRVNTFAIEEDEWQREVGWTMELLEV